MIRKASNVLYRATQNRAYFKDVRILVPETWKNIPANVSTWETFSVSIYVSQLIIVLKPHYHYAPLHHKGG